MPNSSVLIVDNMTLKFIDSLSVKWHNNPINACTYQIQAEAKIDLVNTKLSGIAFNNCAPVVSTDNVIIAFGKLQCQLNYINDNCCNEDVITVTDDGSGVVVVNNTDPHNPIVGFGGVNVDGITITGDGTIANPLVAIGTSVTPHAMTSIDGSVLLTGTPATSLLQDVNVAVNPAFISATVSRPITEIVWGNGIGNPVLSDPKLTYDVTIDKFQQIDSNGNYQTLIDPTSGTYLMRSGNNYDGLNQRNSSQILMQGDATDAGGAFVDIQAFWFKDDYTAFSEAHVTIWANDGVSVSGNPIDLNHENIPGVHFKANSRDKMIIADSYAVLYNSDPTSVVSYPLRFYEAYDAGGSPNYVAFKAANLLAANTTWVLPTTDSTGTQALVSNGAGTLSWASFGAGSVTSVTATPPITSTGGATPVISTSMATSRLIGRTTAGAGVMEQISVSSAFSLTALTLDLTLVDGGTY